MSLTITSQQFFFVVILAFAVIGFQRGWKRELVSLGCTLGVILFLYLGGGKGLAHFFFVSLPAMLQIAVNTGSASNPATGGGTQVSDGNVLVTTLIAFAVVVVAGYLIGNKAFPSKPTQPHERLLGILPAMVSGYFLMLYVTNVLNQSRSTLINIGVNSPNQEQSGNSVFVIFLIALVVVIAALIAASARKKK